MIFLSTLPARGATETCAERGLPLCEFLSTLPARGATLIASKKAIRSDISIHAPREGSDQSRPLTPWRQGNFYPRSPRGERHDRRQQQAQQLPQFLSTLPARGATLLRVFLSLTRSIFLSTLPARGATKFRLLNVIPRRISIHAPREGSDTSGPFCGAGSAISIHAPREGSD